MPGLYGFTGNANVAVSDTPGLYINSGASPILTNAQQLLSLLSNNGTVVFQLDPATGYSTVEAFANASGGGGSTIINLVGDVTGYGATGLPVTTTLANVAVTPGTYGSNSDIPIITVDHKGRVTNVSVGNVATYLPGDPTINSIQSNIVILQSEVYTNANTSAFVNAFLPGYLPPYLSSYTGNVSAGNVNTTSLYVGANATVAGNLTVYGTITYSNVNNITQNFTNIIANATIPSTNSNTGTIISYGGVGVQGNLNADGYLHSNSTVTGTGFFYSNGQNILSGVQGNYGNANVAVYLASNTDPTISNLNANAAIQQIQINTNASNLATLDANVGAFETYANIQVQTINANLGAFETYANIQVQTINANLGAYQTYANANAASQATSINAINANVGAYETWANAAIASVTTNANANTAAYFRGNTIQGNIQANIVTLGPFGSETAPFVAYKSGALNIQGGSSFLGYGATLQLTSNAGVDTYGYGYTTIGSTVNNTLGGQAYATGTPAQTILTGNILIPQATYFGTNAFINNTTLTATLRPVSMFEGNVLFNYYNGISQNNSVGFYSNVTLNGGGNVTVNGPQLNVSTGSSLHTSSFAGAGGNIYLGSGTAIYGDGSKLTGIVSSYGNSNVASYLASATISTTGNISANNLSATNKITATNIYANNYLFANGQPYGGTYTNANVAAYLPNYNGGWGTDPSNGSSDVALGLGAMVNKAYPFPAGNYGIAIGHYAGQYTQGGGIAIGEYAGLYQYTGSIAIGANAGQTPTTGISGTQQIAIGQYAGSTNQGLNAIAIGYSAGQNNQAPNSIMIGTLAGYASSVSNSIVLNTGSGVTQLNPTNAGFYVNPVRNDSGNVTYSVYYNTTTNELTYSTASGGSTYGNANVAAYLPTYTGNLSAGNAAITNLTTSGNVVSTQGYFWGNGSVYGATRIIAGANIVVSPASGVGDVTITALTGGTSGTTTGYYGAFHDSTNQYANVATTAYTWNVGTTDASNGVNIITGNAIQFPFAGVYNIQFSTQFLNTDNATHNANIWIRQNGTDVPASNGQVTIPARKAIGQPGAIIAGWNYVLPVGANDTIQFVWQQDSGDSTVYIASQAAGTSPTRPSEPGIILTATQVTSVVNAYGNSNVATFLGSGFGSNTITTTGAITAGNLITTSGLFWSNGVNYASTVPGTYGNTQVAAYLLAPGPIGSGTPNTGAFTTLAGTLSTASQPNITSVGALTNLTVNGTIIAGTLNAGIIGNTNAAGVFGSLSSTGLTVAGTINATAVNAATIGNTGATLTGTLSTAGQPNITSVGPLTGLTVGGTITATTVNASTIGNSGATLTGTLSTAGQPNITSVGTLTSLTVSGATTSGNLITTNGVFWANGVAYSSGGSSGVSQIVAGTNITISPAGGTGVVTINASGGGLYGNTDVAAYLLAPGPIGSGTPNTGAFTTLAGTLSTASQPNITTLGGVTSIGASGSTTITGTLQTAAQTNITSVGTLSSLTVSGATTSGNLITTNGVFWSNGNPYTSFNGNLAGSVLYDGANERIFANAYPLSTPDATLSGNDFSNFFVNVPVYTSGQLQPPPLANATSGGATIVSASSQTIGLAQSANIGLQSSYGFGSQNRTTVGASFLTSVTPVTANTMNQTDRVRATASLLDINLKGLVWGSMTSSSQNQATITGSTSFTSITSGGSAGAVSGGTFGVFVVPPTTSTANVQYATGMLSFVNLASTAGVGGKANIAYGRMIAPVFSGFSANLSMVNAVGLHTYSGWAGTTISSTSTNGAQNAYAVLNEDSQTQIKTNGNLVLTGNGTVSGGFGLMQHAVYTVAQANAIGGVAGMTVAISNGTGKNNGQLAYWDVTNSRWSWVDTNAALT